ncbi:putative clusterin-associated protein 1-like 3 [Homarus americanus]|uniref:Putative clusterin-associated protein 1-like 3 n=2 Tax=Homarus americanus TaxID=6706 RepID=A0A8J5MRV2_HOMAM|nr:putative clusterin-associated protein 1-like 3 [Homarus americanus]
MTGENLGSSDDSDSIDSILVDSGSEGDSLTLMSAAPQEASVVSEGPLKGAPILKTQPVDSPSMRPASTRPSLPHSPSARPKSSQMGPRESSLTAWTGVRGSGRVSPLSASEDNSDDAF